MNGKSILKYTAVAIAALGLLCARTAQAVDTLDDSAIDTNYLALAGGTAMVPQGDLILIGDFGVVGDATIQGLATGNVLTPANYSTLLNDFIPANIIGSGTVGAGTGPDDGAFNSAFEENNMPAWGNQYLLVFNQTSTNRVGNSTQVGVFRGASWIAANSGDWQFSNNKANGTAGADLDDAATVPLLGTYTANTTLDSTWNDAEVGAASINTFNLDQVMAIPEPSSIMLVVVGLLGMVGLIRRRHS